MPACTSETHSPNPIKETWTVQLDRYNSTQGRIWFFVDVTTTTSTSWGGSCAGKRVTSIRGDFSSLAGRIEPVSLTGSANGTWTQGTGTCNGLGITLSPIGLTYPFVLTGVAVDQSNTTVPSEIGFGPMPGEVLAFQGSWSSSIYQGAFYAYRKRLQYTPDSHFDLHATISETCPSCGPGNPGAFLDINSTTPPPPSLYSIGLELTADTSFVITLPRNTTQRDDQWYFLLQEHADGGGPNDQTTCTRPSMGADLVEVEVISGVPLPTVRCSGGWSSPAILKITGGDNQTGQAGQPLAQPLEVQLVSPTDTPIPDQLVYWGLNDLGATSPLSALTDADGKTTMIWTLGRDSAVQRAYATAGLTTGAVVMARFSAHLSMPAPGTRLPTGVRQETGTQAR